MGGTTVSIVPVDLWFVYSHFHCLICWSFFSMCWTLLLNTFISSSVISCLFILIYSPPAVASSLWFMCSLNLQLSVLPAFPMYISSESEQENFISHHISGGCWSCPSGAEAKILRCWTCWRACGRACCWSGGVRFTDSSLMYGRLILSVPDLALVGFVWFAFYLCFCSEHPFLISIYAKAWSYMPDFLLMILFSLFMSVTTTSGICCSWWVDSKLRYWPLHCFSLYHDPGFPTLPQLY